MKRTSGNICIYIYVVNTRKVPNSPKTSSFSSFTATLGTSFSFCWTITDSLTFSVLLRRFIYVLADTFQILCIKGGRQFVHKYLPLCFARYSFIELRELKH